MATEMDDLIGALNAQRRHVLTAIGGLTDEQLRRPVLPSGWSCLGMLKHLALGDEYYWFRSIIGGETILEFPEPDGDWLIGEHDTADDIIAQYRQEISAADAVLATVEPGDSPRQRDPLWDEWGIDFPTVRYIVLHMVTETACHAGHLDATRELLDGRQWLVL